MLSSGTPRVYCTRELATSPRAKQKEETNLVEIVLNGGNVLKGNVLEVCPKRDCPLSCSLCGLLEDIQTQEKGTKVMNEEKRWKVEIYIKAEIDRGKLGALCIYDLIEFTCSVIKPSARSAAAMILLLQLTSSLHLLSTSFAF